VLLNVIVGVAVAAIIFVGVKQWYSDIRPASAPHAGEWSPAPELALPTPRPIRLTWQGIFIRVCGAIIVSFLLCLWFFIGDTVYEGIARNPEERGLSLVAVALVAGFGLLIGVVFKSFFGPSMERQLLRMGRPARAVITEVRPYVTGYGGCRFRVTFEFKDEVHDAMKGSCDWFLSWTPEIGDIVTAIYDPDDTKHYTLYPARSYGIARF
jgi:hypothetical protein